MRRYYLQQTTNEHPIFVYCDLQVTGSRPMKRNKKCIKLHYRLNWKTYDKIVCSGVHHTLLAIKDTTIALHRTVLTRKLKDHLGWLHKPIIYGFLPASVMFRILFLHSFLHPVLSNVRGFFLGTCNVLTTYIKKLAVKILTINSCNIEVAASRVMLNMPMISIIFFLFCIRVE